MGSKKHLPTLQLVICTTDHGPGAPDMKCTLTDRGTGVMLLLAGPGAFSGGRVIDAMVSHIDIYPTICDTTWKVISY